MSSLLPILDCNNCGACCFEQGSPPGYVAVIAGNAHLWPDEEDIARVASLPEEARSILLDHLSDQFAGEVDGDGPCCWLDQATGRCKFYEHRPNICRELDVGSEGCRSWRDEYNVDIDRLMGARG